MPCTSMGAQLDALLAMLELSRSVECPGLGNRPEHFFVQGVCCLLVPSILSNRNLKPPSSPSHCRSCTGCGRSRTRALATSPNQQVRVRQRGRGFQSVPTQGGLFIASKQHCSPSNSWHPSVPASSPHFLITADADKVIELSPMLMDGHYHKGFALFNMKDYSSAVREGGSEPRSNCRDSFSFPLLRPTHSKRA